MYNLHIREIRSIPQISSPGLVREAARPAEGVSLTYISLLAFLLRLLPRFLVERGIRHL